MTPEEHSLRMQIVETARSCIGTPWQHQGRWPGRGLDCVGLVITAAKAVSMCPESFLKDIPNYGRIPHHNMLLNYMKGHLVQVPRDEAKGGDIPLFCIKSYPMHVGILTDYEVLGDLDHPTGVIHAIAGLGTCAEHRWAFTTYKIHSVFRFRELV